MWKKINFKNILLGVLTALVGLLSTDKAVEYASTGEEPGNLPRTEKPDLVVAPDMFVVEASFYLEVPVKVGNFPDAVVNAPLGVYRLEVKKPSENLLEEAFKAQYGDFYPNAKLDKSIVIKTPDKDKEDELTLPDE